MGSVLIVATCINTTGMPQCAEFGVKIRAERVKRCKAVRNVWRTEESLGLQIFETQYLRVRTMGSQYNTWMEKILFA
jgi:hypothetical protein